MNVIWRNYISCPRIRKVPHRYQSGCHPVAPLGSRILTDRAKVFEHNMWDHMQWSEEEEEEARKKVEENSAVQVVLEEQVKYEHEASKYWDTFYKIHKNKFFKDRNWLLREFPEILPVGQKTEEKVKELSWNHVKINAESFFSKMHCPTMPEEKNHYKESSGLSDGQSKAGSDFSKLDSEEYRDRPLKTELFPGSNATFRILEVGCGAGNSVFPILNTLQNVPEFFLYCCDFASGAVELVKSHASYRAAQCCAFVHDICDHSLPYPFPDGTLDVILLVFVLSSIHPDRMQGVINQLSKLLKPGGMLLFRDYGRYDKTQLRFKRGHCLSENFYVRGDGTRAYFFTKVPYALSLNYEHFEVSTIMQSKSLLYSFVCENYSPTCEELPSWTSEAFRPLNFRYQLLVVSEHFGEGQLPFQVFKDFIIVRMMYNTCSVYPFCMQFHTQLPGLGKKKL